MIKKMRIFTLYFLLMIFSISLVSAVGYDWDNYGGSLPYITQSSDTNAYADLNNGYNFTLMGNGNIYQTLITGLTNESKNYLTFQQSNGYLVVRDGSLNFSFGEMIYMGGSPMGQHASVDWNYDGIKDIATMIRYNSTHLAFKIYSLNSTKNLNNIFTFNFSNLEINGMSGLKCSQNECWTILYDNSNDGFYTWTFLQFSPNFPNNYSASVILTHENAVPVEPISCLDINNDGINEYMAQSIDKILIFSNTTSGGSFIRFNISGEGYKSARFFNANGTYLIGVLTSNYNYLRIYNPDGSLAYSHQNYLSQPAGMCVADYDGDNYDELMTADWYNINSNTNYSVFDGDASLIYRTNQSISGTYIYDLMCAKMEGANTYDFITSGLKYDIEQGIVNIFSPITNNSIFYFDKIPTINTPLSCSAGDGNTDGFLEVICSQYDYNGYTIYIYSTNTTNFTANINPTINSISFYPATTINMGETIYATINAVDNENDTIYYSGRCNSTANFTTENTSSIISCYYANAGSFTITLRVKDAFHYWYNTFSQTIIVRSQNYTQVEGGLALPMDLVNPNNINQGLLPEIYYGILAFASGSYLPLFVIIFGIFVVLIILALFGIVKRIAQKVFE